MIKPIYLDYNGTTPHDPQVIAAKVDQTRLNGHPEERLPNTLSLSFKDLEANRILEEIGLDVAASVQFESIKPLFWCDVALTKALLLDTYPELHQLNWHRNWAKRYF